MGIKAEVFSPQLHLVPGEDIFFRDISDSLIQGFLVLPDGLDGKMGIAGEKAKLQGNGNGNFRQIIMDTVYQMNEEEFLNSAKIRVE